MTRWSDRPARRCGGHRRARTRVANHSATTARSRSAAAPTRATPRTASTPTVSSSTMMGAAEIAVARTGARQIDRPHRLAAAQGFDHGRVALARSGRGPGAGGRHQRQQRRRATRSTRRRRPGTLDRPRARPQPRDDQRQRRLRGGAHVAALDPSRHVAQERERQVETIVARAQRQRRPAQLPQRGRIVTDLRRPAARAAPPDPARVVRAPRRSSSTSSAAASAPSSEGAPAPSAARAGSARHGSARQRQRPPGDRRRR